MFEHGFRDWTTENRRFLMEVKDEKDIFYFTGRHYDGFINSMRDVEK